MQRLILFHPIILSIIFSIILSIIGCLTASAYAQYAADAPPAFEAYGLISGMKTVDATGTIVITNPPPNQPLGFTPSGLASGVRTGFVWP
jgi:hypothetical protein